MNISIVGNWKSNGSLELNKSWIQDFQSVISIPALPLTAICPPHIYLDQSYSDHPYWEKAQNLENFLYTFIVWLFLKKHHLTKEEISASTQFEFRSNWKVLGFSLFPTHWF